MAEFHPDCCSIEAQDTCTGQPTAPQQHGFTASSLENKQPSGVQADTLAASTGPSRIISRGCEQTTAVSIGAALPDVKDSAPDAKPCSVQTAIANPHRNPKALDSASSPLKSEASKRSPMARPGTSEYDDNTAAAHGLDPPVQTDPQPRESSECQTTSAAVNTVEKAPVASCDPLAKQESRVSQLRAKFERQRQSMTESEVHPLQERTPSLANPRNRRQSECTRPSSPHSSATVIRPSQSVREIKSRFEVHEQAQHPAETIISTSTSKGTPPLARRISEATLVQLDTLDIAARYGKTYKSKRRPSSNAQDSCSEETACFVPNTDAAELGSPATSEWTAQKLAQLEISENTRQGVGESETSAQRDTLTPGRGDENDASPSAGSGMCEALGEGGTESADTDGTDGGPSGAAVAATDTRTGETDDPLTSVCGHPSPQIERLAALVAAQAKNYGKRLPRRLLTRQDTDET
ncbi:uncharacterized protein LOC34617398 [Cyclospora cayetanensis]|uniref:Uncharacterized protein n=2 Tax=Cyclospora cayetanensis TaxID=88456 RepID=A0A1D3D5Q1_9EIME|nr:uncharacterized protein LOC34617398 [Cyclospora cayetanensis]OEH78782.1 hypothetical protein cyc_00189 [Cyclospora cayetanensis]